MTTNTPLRSDSGETTPGTARMPALFIGHGSPMNIIADNAWSRGHKKLGVTLPKPRAILSISAHWYTRGTYLTANEHPRTIHDFGGFPQALYEIEYRAPGAPKLASKIRTLIARSDAHTAELSADWGLDHGTWAVLHHMYPAANIPVLQLSLDRRLTAQQHLAIARELAPLRDEGVLIMGSGNITHNLRDAFTRMRANNRTVPAWAARFDSMITTAIQQRDTSALAGALDTADGRVSHPSPDHYLPLLYTYGATTEADVVHSPIEGWDASLSMRSLTLSTTT